MDTFMGQLSVKLLLSVGIELPDEVNEVVGFLELLEIFGIDQISELIFDLNAELDHIQRVEVVVLEVGFKSDAGLLCCSKIILDN